MDKIFIKTSSLPEWADEYFKNRDIITIDELVATMDDIVYRLREKQDEIENIKQNIEDNYKFVGQAEQVGYNANW